MLRALWSEAVQCRVATINVHSAKKARTKDTTDCQDSDMYFLKPKVVKWVSRTCSEAVCDTTQRRSGLRHVR